MHSKRASHVLPRGRSRTLSTARPEPPLGVLTHAALGPDQGWVKHPASSGKISPLSDTGRLRPLPEMDPAPTVLPAVGWGEEGQKRRKQNLTPPEVALRGGEESGYGSLIS